MRKLNDTAYETFNMAPPPSWVTEVVIYDGTKIYRIQWDTCIQAYHDLQHMVKELEEAIFDDDM